MGSESDITSRLEGKIKLGDVEFNYYSLRLCRHNEIFNLRKREADFLRCLIQKYPDVTTRKELEEQIWGGTYVSDPTINQTVKNTRQALGDKDKTLIKTISKVGYQLTVAPQFLALESIATVNDEADYKSYPHPVSNAEIQDDIKQRQEVERKRKRRLREWMGIFTLTLSVTALIYIVYKEFFAGEAAVNYGENMIEVMQQPYSLGKEVVIYRTHENVALICVRHQTKPRVLECHEAAL
ncbi:winged helix-turn-helix domain-containing protein [Parasalinivibrio latis]|uniref:winged helix-turn-helix domain-containing protein n=1 Tax=Parasalinivibrio latis TaxID=2952610 RepID=UPI0030E305A6